MPAAAGLDRAGVLPPGGLPVPPAAARVRLPRPQVRRRRGAQVGGEAPARPPGLAGEGAGAGAVPGAPGWGRPPAGSRERSPHRHLFTPKLEGVPLPVSADAREGGAGLSGKAVVRVRVCCDLRVFFQNVL